MAAGTKSKVTTDHEEIRRWAVGRGGTPALMNHSKSASDGDAPIRVCFPVDGSHSSSDEISWEDWFRKFDAAKLAFLYQELTAGGEKSSFNKLVSREIVDEVEVAVGGKGRSASRRRSRRPAAAGGTATLPDGKPERDAKPGTGSRKVNKKSGAIVASVSSGKKQLPAQKASPDRRP
ncbi:MAG: hypothetical protein WBM04_05555 [Candidatus Korobacteraceae bacterium]